MLITAENLPYIEIMPMVLVNNAGGNPLVAHQTRLTNILDDSFTHLF
jgi:hypothetical protein